LAVVEEDLHRINYISPLFSGAGISIQGVMR